MQSMSQPQQELIQDPVDLVLASEHLREIRQNYDSTLIRSYVWARFVIIHIDILELLDRLVPKNGRILDMGCGFWPFFPFPGDAVTGPCPLRCRSFGEANRGREKVRGKDATLECPV